MFPAILTGQAPFSALWSLRCVGQRVDRPTVDHLRIFTWEPDPQSGSESRVSTDGAGHIGSVTLKSEDRWQRVCWHLLSLYLHL